MYSVLVKDVPQAEWLGRPRPVWATEPDPVSTKIKTKEKRS
jgi:hypothetical protein